MQMTKEWPVVAMEGIGKGPLFFSRNFSRKRLTPSSKMAMLTQCDSTAEKGRAFPNWLT